MYIYIYVYICIYIYNTYFGLFGSAGLVWCSPKLCRLSRAMRLAPAKYTPGRAIRPSRAP